MEFFTDETGYPRFSKERRERLAMILSLAGELARIREEHQFAVLLAENAVESLIIGDWGGVATWLEYFTFESEGDRIREKYVPIWAKFQKTLVEAYESRPEDG